MSGDRAAPEAADGGPEDWPRGGVHRVPGPAVAVAGELAGRGWRVGLVAPVTTDDGLWDGLAGALALPGWFGRNLDALDEVLGDLADPTALVLAGWTAYARARPERWTRLLGVLGERADAGGPRFVVLLADHDHRDRGGPERD